MLVLIFEKNLKAVDSVKQTENKSCFPQRLCCTMEMRLKIVEAFAELGQVEAHAAETVRK